MPTQTAQSGAQQVLERLDGLAHPLLSDPVRHRVIVAATYHRLIKAGVVVPVELLDGRVVIGSFGLVFTDSQLAAALEAGVNVRAAEAPRETTDSQTTAPTDSDT